MASMIPMRPAGTRFDLTQDEMDGLTYYVLSGCAREDAFLKFIRPDFLGSKSPTIVKAAVSQFFASKDAKEYMEEYRKTIHDLLNKKPEPSAPKASIEERKAKAKTKLVEFAMSLADHIEDADDPEAVLKIADKIGLLDQDEEVEEQPRRYIPVQCLSECRYRLFVEENCTDDCQYCKYRQYGEENGIHFAPEQQLNIPTNQE